MKPCNESKIVKETPYVRVEGNETYTYQVEDIEIYKSWDCASTRSRLRKNGIKLSIGNRSLVSLQLFAFPSEYGKCS